MFEAFPDANPARVNELRDSLKAGNTVDVQEFAKALGTSEPDLTSALTLAELAQRSRCAAIVATQNDGVVLIRNSAPGEVSLTCSISLATVLLAGILAADKSATLAIAAPLPDTGRAATN